jgi:5-methylcytosine-specific restriction endonuclease McrA
MSNSETTIQKRCARCGDSFPATPEYFHRNKARPDGLQHRCKTCHAADTRAHYESLKQPENLERLIVYKQESLERNRRHYAVYPEKSYERNRRYRTASSEKIREYNRFYYVTHSEQYRERERRYRAASPEKYRQKRCLEYHLRRAAGNVVREDLIHLRKLQNNCCAYCGQVLQKGKTHVDHIRPVSKGGRSDRDNLCLACARCNLQKHDRTPEEWTHRWYEN